MNFENMLKEFIKSKIFEADNVREFPVQMIRLSHPEKIKFTAYFIENEDGMKMKDITSGRTIANSKTKKGLAQQAKNQGYKFYIDAKESLKPRFFYNIDEL